MAQTEQPLKMNHGRFEHPTEMIYLYKTIICNQNNSSLMILLFLKNGTPIYPVRSISNGRSMVSLGCKTAMSSKDDRLRSAGNPILIRL